MIALDESTNILTATLTADGVVQEGAEVTVTIEDTDVVDEPMDDEGEGIYTFVIADDILTVHGQAYDVRVRSELAGNVRTEFGEIVNTRSTD